MRKIGIIIVALVVLIIAALLVAPAFINVNSFRGRIEAELQKRLGRPVQVGQMHLRLLPLKFSVDNATIGENPQFGSGPFATIRGLTLSPKLMPLLHHDVELSGVELQRPHVELIRNAQGVWNFSTLGSSAPASAPPPPGAAAPPKPQSQPSAPKPQPSAPAPAAKPGGAPAIELDSLRIVDGQIAVTDQQKHQSRAVYDHIDATLKNFAPDKAFDLSLAAHLPGKGAETVSLTGTAGPVNQTNMSDTPFNGRLKLNDVLISGVQKFLNAQALSQVDGMISGEATVKNQNSTISSAGSLKIDGAQVRGAAIGYPITADYDVNDNLNSDVIQISKGNIRLGSTPLAVSGTLNTKPTPAQMDLKLKAQDVSLAEAARLASVFGVAFNSETKVDGRASADVTAQGATSQPALNGTLSARNLSISGRDIPTPVKVPAIDLALTPSQIRSNNFNASAANTNLAVQFTASNYTSASPLIDATVRTANAQIGDLISIARAWAPGAVQGVSGSGVLTLDVHATGPVKNANAMNFSGTGQVQNASVKNADLHQPLNLKNANLSFTQNTAQVQNLAASLAGTTVTGAASVRNFSAPNVQFTLNADKVNIAELQQALGTAPPQQAPRKAALAEPSIVPRAYAEPAPKPAAAPAGAAMLANMTGGGTIHIGTVQYDQMLLTNTNAKVALDHGIVRLAPVTAQLYDGQETGTIVVDTRTNPMSVQVNTQLQRVRANDLISSFTSIKNTIYGLLAANTQVHFQAASANDVARSLNGNAALDLSNGRIAKLDLLNELAAIGKFAGVRKNAQAVTDFTKLTGHFNITNGVATTNDLRADIANGSLAANGAVNLATQELNMHLTAVLSKGFTQTVGGAGIGGMMQTALANNRGELVMPVLVTGTFDHPQVAPDVQKVAQMKLQNMLPTAGNPGTMTTGILGALKGGKAGAGTSQQGGIGGVLGAITGQQQPAAPGQQPANPSQQPAQEQQNPAQGQPNAAQGQPNSQKPGDVLNQALGGILGGKKQQPQQPQPPPK